MHGAAGISAGLFSPWGREGLLRVLVEASFSSHSCCAIPSEGWVNRGTEELRRCTGVGSPGQTRRVPQLLDDTVFHGDSPEDRLLLGRPSAFCGKKGESR